MSGEQKRRDEEQAPGGAGPVDLARAVLSWIVVAVATLITMWVLLFAATRGDFVGLVIAVAAVGLLIGVALLRRRSR